MSVSYDNMTEQAMIDEGKRLMAAVQNVKLASQVQDLIQEECDKAFAKDDACPVGTDILYLPDVSQSMLVGGVPAPWDQQLQFVKGVASQAIKYDDGGIDIWPIYAPSSLEKLSDKEIECKLHVTDPNKAFEYVKGYEDKLGTTPTRKLFSRLVGDVVEKAIADPIGAKRTLFLISTDGQPDRNGPPMWETTRQAILTLHHAGLNPTRYIAVSYVILTQDFTTMACYYKLEDNKSWDTEQEYDVANAIFPFQIKSLGGFDNKTTVNIALGGAVSPAIDTALETILGDDAKSLMRLMKVYNKKGFAKDC
ncbi:hypothetical protein AU210_016370 [Fusarium oxysporum f. sp. radicis-cucumerinum]|uniref:Uncharacterized protein n=1 Tax=Fusarium oxysporum f. sp. radicis-cucumerinum TaxID=327505 RepID=A0A2H3FP36_FUSOX|nr:hypothetical protein AU210_016370 [Fusarium oxysporum f. sp. radicis-cucumerinum]